jgi:regulation of enolase protein 1 (concanavalin A-like superfamily)
VALAGPRPEQRRILIQAAFRDASGRLLYGSPRMIDVPDQPGPIVAGGRLDAVKRAVAERSFARLGPLVDPDKDCTLTKDPRTRTFKIAIPTKLHSLSPILTRQGAPIHNAPRMLCDVDGDFLISARVTGNMDPGSDPPNDPRGRRLPYCYAGAGLIVYQDAKNFLRLERACSSAGANKVRELLIEGVLNGKRLDPPIELPLRGDPSAPIDLILVRSQNTVRCLFSPDGRTLLAFRELTLNFPARVQVGLSASNISKKPFAAEFEDFVILTDKDPILREFGKKS